MAPSSLNVYRVNKFDVRTDLKIKEGKLLYYEVTSLPNSKTRNYVAKVKTLREAREKAKKIASAPGYGSEIFRWYLHDAYTDSTRTKLKKVSGVFHIETWYNEGTQIRVEEF
jgi:hypothetical protein